MIKSEIYPITAKDISEFTEKANACMKNLTEDKKVFGISGAVCIVINEKPKISEQVEAFVEGPALLLDHLDKQ